VKPIGLTTTTMMIPSTKISAPRATTKPINLFDIPVAAPSHDESHQGIVLFIFVFSKRQVIENFKPMQIFT